MKNPVAQHRMDNLTKLRRGFSYYEFTHGMEANHVPVAERRHSVSQFKNWHISFRIVRNR